MKRNVGFAVSIICIVAVLWRIDWRSTLASFTRIEILPVAAAVVLLVISYLLQAQRWRLAINARSSLPFARAFGLLLIGNLGNVILPLRAGDLLRVVLAARALGLGKSRLFAVLILERLLDVLSLLAYGAVVISAVAVPSEAVTAMRSVGAAFGAAILLIVAIIAGGNNVTSVLRRVARRYGIVALFRFADTIEQIVLGIRTVASASRLALLTVLSLVSWGFVAGAMICFLAAFRLSLPPQAGVLLMVITNLGVALPSAPAGIGIYHALVLLTLAVWYVDMGVALGVALVSHIVIVGIQLIGGAVAAWFEGGLHRLRAEAAQDGLV